MGRKFLVYVKGISSSGISPQQRPPHFEKQNAPWSRHFNFFSSTRFRGYNAGHRREKIENIVLSMLYIR
jgi:hypothetical protein